MTTSFRAAYPAFRIDGETPRLEAGKLLTPTEGATHAGASMPRR
jgi:hypothetical protein